MKKIILIICLFLGLSLTAQNRTIDSLKLVLKSAKHDTTRCTILNAMVEVEEDDSLWQKYNDQLKAIAEKNLASSSLSGPLKKNYLQHLANSLNNIGFFYNSTGEIKKALDNCSRSLKIQEQIGDKEGCATSLNMLATIFEKQGQIKKALDYFMCSLKISEKIGDKEGAAATLINLGLINQNLGQTKEALDRFNRSLKIQEEIADKEGIATSLNNIGGIYHKNGNVKVALDYYSRGMKINKEIGNQEGIANALNNIGSLYVRIGQMNKALDQMVQSLNIYEKINNKHGVVSALRNIGAIHLKQGQLNKAFYYGSKGLGLAKELGYPGDIESSAHLMSIIYEKQSKGMQSLEMYKLYIQMRDSVKNKDNQKTAFRKEAQYKYEKQRSEDSITSAKNIEVKNLEIDKQKTEINAKKTQQYFLFGGLGLMIVFAGFMFNRFKVTQKQKNIIEKQKGIVEEQKKLVDEKQKEMLDSINYAKRIQNALLPTEKYIRRKLTEMSFKNGD